MNQSDHDSSKLRRKQLNRRGAKAETRRKRGGECLWIRTFITLLTEREPYGPL